MVRNLLTPSLRRFLEDYASGLAKRGRLQDGDIQVPGTPCRFGDPVMESLLQALCPRFEQASGLALWPTYSYFRVYARGDRLPRHTDRPSCEISATVNLGQEADAAWPIWIDPGAGPLAIELSPGDAMIYRGLDVPHWRETFRGARLTQVFLHYVDQDGPHREWKFDKRQGLDIQPGPDAMLRKLIR